MEKWRQVLHIMQCMQRWGVNITKVLHNMQNPMQNYAEVYEQHWHYAANDSHKKGFANIRHIVSVWDVFVRCLQANRAGSHVKSVVMTSQQWHLGCSPAAVMSVWQVDVPGKSMCLLRCAQHMRMCRRMPDPESNDPSILTAGSPCVEICLQAKIVLLIGG